MFHDHLFFIKKTQQNEMQLL